MSHVLTELPSNTARETTLNALWGKTAKFLVLVDNGTPEGFRIIAEARSFILQQGNASVVAPCPHDGVCPL